MSAPIRFCPHCGTQAQWRTPNGDTVPRHCCDACGHIQYQNPKLVMGTLPFWEDKVLLCRRAIEPRHGFWTLPAGFMENHETTAQAAARETDEEAGLQIELLDLYTLISVPHVSQIHGFYLARMRSQDMDPGPETLEARLFSEAEIPWEQIAFRTVSLTVRHYFADRKQGTYPFRNLEIGPPPA